MNFDGNILDISNHRYMYRDLRPYIRIIAIDSNVKEFSQGKKNQSLNLLLDQRSRSKLDIKKYFGIQYICRYINV